MPGVSAYDDGTPAGGGSNSEGAAGASLGNVVKNLAAAAINALSSFYLLGGYYALSAIATGYGSITLQQLGPDGLTKLTAAPAIVANGITYVYLPPGTYNWSAVSVTAAYATIVRIPVG